jgi:hypothetical protein
MIITDRHNGCRWIIEKIGADSYRVTYQEHYAGAGWRTIGPADICSRDCIYDALECIEYEHEVEGELE